VLLRGHGFVGAGRSAGQLIRMCKALLDNAAVQLEASRLGPLKEMTAAEIDARQRTLGADDDHPSMMRGFEYEAIEADLQDLLKERAELKARQ
jgi:ribulose-5-phosphate 4-epimerase/fuculose-1-phosphate aldolase